MGGPEKRDEREWSFLKSRSIKTFKKYGNVKPIKIIILFKYSVVPQFFDSISNSPLY